MRDENSKELTIWFEKNIRNVMKWNAEQPNLYQLQITLTDPFGNTSLYMNAYKFTKYFGRDRSILS